MPDGRLHRIDHDHQLAYVIRRGRTYAAALSEVEPAARVPNARVRFHLERHRGSERATSVRLRTGTRTSRRQRRFGDLTGARRPGAKAATIASRTDGIDVATQPFRVATAWIQAMADQDYDRATSLYLPGAGLTTPEGSDRGRRHIRAELERSGLVDVEADRAELHGLDRSVVIDFDDRDGHHSTALIIEHGAIVEQWLDVEPPEADREPGDGLPAIELVHRGAVPTGAASAAEHRIEAFIEHLDRPCRYASLKLTGAENPTVRRPAMAQVTIELDRFHLRAQSTAETFDQAIDEVVGRLAAQLESQRDRERHKPVGRTAAPGNWRHGNLASTVEPYFLRPAPEREIVRHKSFAADELTIDEAAWDMAALDYDFFLFVELESGQDSLIERTEDGSLVVRHLQPVTDHPANSVIDCERSAIPAPELAVSAAIEMLNETGDPLVFFRNIASGRGNVVYRRYDGHYGLITPPSDEPDGFDGPDEDDS